MTNARGAIEKHGAVRNFRAVVLPTRRNIQFDAAGCISRVDRVVGGVTQSTNTYTCGKDGTRAIRDYVVGGTTKRVREFLGFVETRQTLPTAASDDVTLIRLPINGIVTLEDAWNMGTGTRVESSSGFVHTDIRGSIVARTGWTGIADVTSDAEYDAWGNSSTVSESTKPIHQFLSEEPDPDIGLYHFGVRAYDPTLRRWLSADPLFFMQPELDGSGGRELNLYAYARNNPVAFTDPTGMESVGEIIQRKGTEAAERGDDLDTAAWAFAEAAWNLFGAEGISQVADDGANVSAGDGVAAAVEVATSLPGASTAKAAAKAAVAGVEAVAKLSAKTSAKATARDGAQTGTRKVVEKTASGKRKGDYTPKQRREAKADNAKENGGKMKCTDCKKEVRSVKNEKGVPTPPDQAQVHHEEALKNGGGRDSPATVLCPPCHRERHRGDP